MLSQFNPLAHYASWLTQPNDAGTSDVSSTVLRSIRNDPSFKHHHGGQAVAIVRYFFGTHVTLTHKFYRSFILSFENAMDFSLHSRMISRKRTSVRIALNRAKSSPHFGTATLSPRRHLLSQLRRNHPRWHGVSPRASSYVLVLTNYLCGPPSTKYTANGCLLPRRLGSR